MTRAIPRRTFLSGSAIAAAAGGFSGLRIPSAVHAATGGGAGEESAESLVKLLHASLSPAQREKICVPWNYVHPKFGLLRTRVGNNWNCNDSNLASEFFTADQKRLSRAIFESLIAPEWHERFDRQLEDDTGGFGHEQSIALIGEPGSGAFQFLLTGRHMTLRCDGDSADHVAFGGPIFYGHDPGGFNEAADHPGNVFWPQAVAANRVFAMLDGRQRSAALSDQLPREQAIAFRRGPIPGLPVSELTGDQREELDRVLASLLEPYRVSDRDEARRCLARQAASSGTDAEGAKGLDACRLVFYRQGDIGNDAVWDNWRLEGPSFVWHYRGAPHVHVWVNIADDPSVPTNA
jgi:hypothetical protein